MKSEPVIILEADAVAAVRYQTHWIHRGNQKRGIKRFPLSRLRMGAAGEWAFFQWITSNSKLSFAGPLPYCGAPEHSPEDFVAFPSPRERVKIDLHTISPDGPLTYPAWHWRRKSFPDYLVVAQLEPESMDWDAPTADWNPTEIRVTLLGAIGGELMANAKAHRKAEFEGLNQPRIPQWDHFQDDEGIWHLCISPPSGGSSSPYCRLPRDWIKLDSLGKLATG